MHFIYDDSALNRLGCGDVQAIMMTVHLIDPGTATSQGPGTARRARIVVLRIGHIRRS